jgi:hypothetical protein
MKPHGGRSPLEMLLELSRWTSVELPVISSVRTGHAFGAPEM